MEHDTQGKPRTACNLGNFSVALDPCESNALVSTNRSKSADCRSGCRDVKMGALMNECSNPYRDGASTKPELMTVWPMKVAVN